MTMAEAEGIVSTETHACAAGNCHDKPLEPDVGCGTVAPGAESAPNPSAPVPATVASLLTELEVLHTQRLEVSHIFDR